MAARLGTIGILVLASLLLATPVHATLPGPNGRIAFVKNGDIYSVNPDGSGLLQLTKTSSITEADPAFSPDGNYIAFTRNGGGQLFIMRSDGGEPKWVTNVGGMQYLAWSPDGTKIAIFRRQSSTTGIWLINRDGTGLTNLITDESMGSAFSWSPDGSKLAISRGTFHEIWTMNADGTGLTQLTFSVRGVNNLGPNWSPDGSKIVFSSDQDCVQCSTSDIYAIPSSGGAVSRLTNLPGALNTDPIWSPDGTRIVFASCVDIDCTRDLYTMSADGSGLAVLQNTSADEAEPNWQPAVGPPLPPIPEMLDKIAFISTRNHSGINYPEDVFTMNPDGTAQRALTDDQWYDGGPAWSPDGAKIAFGSNLNSVQYDIYVMNPDGSGRTNITHTGGAVDEGGPVWSPDGSRIAFTRDDGSDHEQLWVMNSDGSGAIQLTPGPRDGPTSWSPDGTRILFIHSGAIYTIKPDATGLTQITSPPTNGSEGFADWSPDGSKIAFSRFLPAGSGSVSNIWTMNSDGSAQQQITNLPTGAGHPSWSPDGSKIAFHRQASNASYGTDIFVMNPDGTGQVDVTNSLGDDEFPDWKRVSGYPRPKGASPMVISLVPAYPACTSPDRTHGAPLAFGSCSHPQLTSQTLTVGTPDVNGKRTTMQASIVLKVTGTDVKITSDVNNVFNKDMTDYTGGLRAHLPLQITDKDNTPSPGFPGAATVAQIPFDFDLACTATADTTIGSDCPLSTTANALVPGSVSAGLRAIWQVGQAQVYDGGADGNPNTTSDNTLYLDQGIFVP